jgi:putative component of membrane protein insertase Oxa1/YidC/SpoIIIJ protein YidD
LKAQFLLFLLLFSLKVISQESNLKSGNEALDDYFRFYRTSLREGLGTHCSMYPSCSNYSSLAIRERGAFYGSLLTADRLIRCGQDLSFYNKKVLPGGQTVFKDYPDENKNSLELSLSSGSLFFYQDTLGSHLDKYFIGLYDRGFYTELITQYHFFEASKAQDITQLMRYLYLSSLVKTGEKEIALREIEILTNPINPDCLYMQLKGDIHLDMGHSELARNEYNKILNSNIVFDSCKVANRLALTYFREFDWKNGVGNLCGDEVFVKKSIVLVDRAVSVKKKVPAFAAILSVIPGAGYLYTDKPKAALTSFCFNGLMMFASYDLLRKKEYGMAALTGFFSINFYLGNIVGSYRSAKDRNRKLSEQSYRSLYTILY